MGIARLTPAKIKVRPCYNGNFPQLTFLGLLINSNQRPPWLLRSRTHNYDSSFFHSSLDPINHTISCLSISSRFPPNFDPPNPAHFPLSRRPPYINSTFAPARRIPESMRNIFANKVYITESILLLRQCQQQPLMLDVIYNDFQKASDAIDHFEMLCKLSCLGLLPGFLKD